MMNKLYAATLTFSFEAQFESNILIKRHLSHNNLAVNILLLAWRLFGKLVLNNKNN